MPINKETKVNEAPMWENNVMSLVTSEKRKYEDTSAQIRRTIRRAYRNFWGIYDVPNTRYTKRKKIFWQLTQFHTVGAASRIYVDPRAINILPKREDAIVKAMIWNHLLPSQLQQIGFFQKMNDFSLDLSLFGTVVSFQGWDFKKEVIFEEVSKAEAKKLMDKDDVEVLDAEVNPMVKKEKIASDQLAYEFIPLLNCYIDATADSIQKAPSFIVTSFEEVADLPALKRDNMWKGDISGVEGTKLITTVNKDNRWLTVYAQKGISQRRLEVPMVEILQRYGKINLSWITGKEEDEGTWAEGRIVLLNQNPGRGKFQEKDLRILDVSLNRFKHGMRPFEECWYIKVPGRWYGLGNGEMLDGTNSYVNRIMNQRIDNNEITQHQMYKATKRAGLDVPSIAAAPGKVIEVNNMDEFEVLNLGSADPSSYTDEQNALVWAEKMTHVRELSEAGSATEATIDENINGEFFAIIRRNVNDYLRRTIEQFMKLDEQYLDKDIAIRLSGEEEDFTEFDDLVGFPGEIRGDIGPFRFLTVKNVQDIIDDFDVEVDIDNSMPMSKRARLQGLERVLQQAIQDPDAGLNRRQLYKEWVQSLLGTTSSRFFTNTQDQSVVTAPGAQPTQQGPQGQLATPPIPGVPNNNPEDLTLQ